MTSFFQMYLVNHVQAWHVRGNQRVSSSMVHVERFRVSVVDEVH